jgi:predicted transcriptional regulator YdeE
MNIEIVERPEMKAAVLQIPRDGNRVREAKKKVATLLDGHPAVADRENYYVFIPEWQWTTEVTTLWVGVKVDTFDGLPGGLEQITIPAKKFAKITVNGDRTRMDETYGYLADWFRTGPYERDMSEGSLGYEMNRLRPVDPFEIPADKITYFEFDIYAPIKEGKVRDTRLTDKIVVDEKGSHVLQDLRGENVLMVSFQGARFHGIDMRDAKLRHVNFVNSEWEHIYFANVRINMIQMGGTVFENIKRPDATESRLDAEPGTDGWVNVEPVIFRNSDLSTARFENCDLRDVSIEGCRLEGMRIDGIPVAQLLAHYRETGKSADHK